MSKKLIVIVPAYNEAERIEGTISALLKIRDKIEAVGYEYCIYVINDGSVDDTAALAQEAGASRVINHKTNQGLGAAIRTGLAASRSDQADIVVKFDADLQHDPEDILVLIQPILDDEADLVYGNRFEKIEYSMSFVRKIGNTVFTRLMRWLTGWPLKDSQPGIFAAGRAYLDVFYLPGSYNYTQQILIDAYHKGMRFAQIPVVFRKRRSGESFVSFKYPFKVLPEIIRVLVGVKPLLIFGSIGFGFMLVGFSTFVWNIGGWLFGDALKPVENVNAVLGFSLFGLQTLFFGLLADLIVMMRKH